MSLSARNVEGWMGEELYKKLGDEPNIELTWKYLRNIIEEHLFDSEYVTVPYIESAIYYNQLFVFIKKREVWSTLGITPPTYKIVGNLDYLVNRDVSTWVPMFDFSSWDIVDGLKMYREYKLRVTSRGLEIEKSIELKIMECHARSVEPPMPGALTIHTNLLEDLKHVRSLYVITDVVFASHVKLRIRIGAQEKSIIYVQDTPIGFKYRKYKLNRAGLIGLEIPTHLQYAESEAFWLKPTPQPIPIVSRWDAIRRRYTSGSSKSKAKSNLTIPTPELPRRARRREGRALTQGERPFQNEITMNARNILDVNNNRGHEDDDWRDFFNQRRMNDQQNVYFRSRRVHSLDNIVTGA